MVVLTDDFRKKFRRENLGLEIGTELFDDDLTDF